MALDYELTIYSTIIATTFYCIILLHSEHVFSKASAPHIVEGLIFLGQMCALRSTHYPQRTCMSMTKTAMHIYWLVTSSAWKIETEANVVFMPTFTMDGIHSLSRNASTGWIIFTWITHLYLQERNSIRYYTEVEMRHQVSQQAGRMR